MIEKYFLYIITNTVNGKQYIGWTTKTLRERLVRHFCESRRDRSKARLYKAIRKYGQEKFQIELQMITDSFDYINKMEIAAIKIYDTFRNGYNSTLGGEGVTGYQLTEKQKKQRSINAKRYQAEQRKNRPPKPPKKKIKPGSWLIGRPRSEEAKQKASRTLKGRVPWNKGLKGKQDPRNFRSPEIMEKTHSKTRGKPKPHKSEEMKKKWSDPVFREMMLNARKSKKNR